MGLGIATFTTSASIDAFILGYQLSGTGPHVVSPAHLDFVTDFLTNGGSHLPYFVAWQ